MLGCGFGKMRRGGRGGSRQQVGARRVTQEMSEHREVVGSP